MNPIQSDQDAEENHPWKRLKTVEDPEAAPGNPDHKARICAAKAEAHWKKQGHLSRASTQRKYVGSTLQVPTGFKIESQPIKVGGYSMLSKATMAGSDALSLEQALKMDSKIPEAQMAQKVLLETFGSGSQRAPR